VASIHVLRAVRADAAGARRAFYVVGAEKVGYLHARAGHLDGARDPHGLYEFRLGDAAPVIAELAWAETPAELVARVAGQRWDSWSGRGAPCVHYKLPAGIERFARVGRYQVVFRPPDPAFRERILEALGEAPTASPRRRRAPGQWRRTT
jgi:hypothetical protein